MSRLEPLRCFLPHGLPEGSIAHSGFHFWESGANSLCRRGAAGRLAFPQSSPPRHSLRENAPALRHSCERLIPTAFGGPPIAQNTTLGTGSKLQPRNAYSELLAHWHESNARKHSVDVLIEEFAGHKTRLYRRILTAINGTPSTLLPELVLSNMAERDSFAYPFAAPDKNVQIFLSHSDADHASVLDLLHASHRDTLDAYPRDQVAVGFRPLQRLAPPRERLDLPPGDPVRAFQIHAEKLRGRYGEGVEPIQMDTTIARTMAAKGWKQQDIAEALTATRFNTAVQTHEDVAQYAQSIAARAAEQAQQTREAVNNRQFGRDPGRDRS